MEGVLMATLRLFVLDDLEAKVPQWSFLSSPMSEKVGIIHTISTRF